MLIYYPTKFGCYRPSRSEEIAIERKKDRGDFSDSIFITSQI